MTRTTTERATASERRDTELLPVRIQTLDPPGLLPHGAETRPRPGVPATHDAVWPRFFHETELDRLLGSALV